MAETHPQMRETTTEIRENEAGAVHASRNAALLERILRHRWFRTAGFSIAIGAFLSFIGAFGTMHIPPLPRTMMFLAYSLYAGLLALIVVTWARRQAWIDARPGLRPIVIAAIMTLLMTLSVWGGFSVFQPEAQSRLVPLFLTCLVMSAAVTAVATAVFRPMRFTHVAPGAVAAPRFLARLPIKLRGADLWAIQAEDHYLRLHTSRGEELILMRLADAMGELDGIEGAQTHRSWWVARASVSEVKRSDNKLALTLPNGTLAPVSRTYAPVLRKAGWL